MMRKKIRRRICTLLSFIIILSSVVMSFAANTTEIGDAVSNTASYMLKTAKSLQVGSIGGEWMIIGLARSGYAVDENFYQDYYAKVEDYVKACKGLLHTRKYTEYSRVILALTAIGKDPANVAGYNLLAPLGDFDKTIWQGINGPIWALIALDSGSYDMPVNNEAESQATRDMYVNEILNRQLDDGGFALSGTIADTDITAMAMQALSKYRYRDDVAEVIGKALICLSKLQDKNGGYASWGTANSESAAQVIVALGELGISIDDSRFVKNGYTLVDNLLINYCTINNGFKHTLNGTGSNQMATEQVFYALVSAQRNMNDKKSLYDMSDAISINVSDRTEPKANTGLKGKNADVMPQRIIYPGKTFSDIAGKNTHENQAAIEALASFGIISGYEDNTFRPDNSMTRAEFTGIIVRALGLKPETSNIFTDISSSCWFAPYVGTANSYGIVHGKSSTGFDPGGTITRQEAAAMVARAAKLCGMNTSMDTAVIRDVLAQFTDYMQVDGWAQESMAFCYSSGALNLSDLNIRPDTVIKRCEIAQMLFNMLREANLL